MNDLEPLNIPGTASHSRYLSKYKTYLSHHRGIRYFRITVPNHLRSLLGKTEIRRSLDGMKSRTARSKAVRLSVAAQTFFALVEEIQSGRIQLVHGTSMQHPEPLYICGPTSAGKSSLIRQTAARLNYPVFETTGHDRVEFPDLVGHLSVQNGNMIFEDGPLTMAMKLGGIFLFNEADLCSPATLAGLNTILDGSPLCIAENGGELVKPSPMFRFIVTANSNGNSDETGLYQGVMRQNIALMDRFMLVEMGYPKAEVERDLLNRMFPEIPAEITEKMVDFANDVRRNFMGNSSAHDALEVTLSTRTLIRWARLTIAFQHLSKQGISPIMYALDRALGFRASTTSRAALHEMAQRIFPSISN